MENQRIRVIKTMLKNALMQLLEKKPIEKITIYELCDKAQINRTTFYKYYGSQYDLLSDIENDRFGRLEELLSERGAVGEDILCRVLEALHEDEKSYKILINALPDKDFSAKLSIFRRSGCRSKRRSRRPFRHVRGSISACSSIRAGTRSYANGSIVRIVNRPKRSRRS